MYTYVHTNVHMYVVAKVWVCAHVVTYDVICHVQIHTVHGHMQRC